MGDNKVQVSVDGKTYYVDQSTLKQAKKTAGKGEPLKLDQVSVFAQDSSVRGRLSTDNTFAGTSLALRGADARSVLSGDQATSVQDRVLKNSEYKDLQKDIQRELKEAYEALRTKAQELRSRKGNGETLTSEELQTLDQIIAAANLTDDQIKKLAKAEAKDMVNAMKAADEVRTAVYFTPDQKKEYEDFKKNNKDGGQHAVLLTEDDMKRMGQFFPAEGSPKDEHGHIKSKFVKYDANGNRTISPEAQKELKEAAADLVGDDNTLSYEERFDLTRTAKKEDKKMSHGSARITKNFFKHLGFDHEYDFTETKLIAGISTMALGPVLHAIKIGGTAGKWLLDVLDGGGKVMKWLAGTPSHALIGIVPAAAISGAGAVITSSALTDKKDTPKAVLEEKQDPDVPPTGDDDQDQDQGQDPVIDTPSEDTTPQPPAKAEVRASFRDQGLRMSGGYTDDMFNKFKENWKQSLEEGYDGSLNQMQTGQRSQFGLGDEKDEVDYTGDNPAAPETITLNDNTNDKVKNKYVFRKITPEELEKGQLQDGTQLNEADKKAKAEGKELYVLVSADKADTGTDIKSTHTEVYVMTAHPASDDQNAYYYEMEQTEGMSGYKQSSIDYSRRAASNGTNDFKWGNWTRRKDIEQQMKQICSSGLANAPKNVDDIIKLMTPAPNREDLIKANPSIFDKDGNILENANWSKLDLPKGTLVKIPEEEVADEGAEGGV